MVADLPPPMPVVAEVRLFDPFASLGPFLAMQAVEEAAQQPVEAEEAERDPLAEPDTGIIDGRRRPGYQPRLPDKVSQENIGAVRPPPPEAFPTEEFPIPDRWRLVETLGLVKERWYDPYNQNTYKGDRPINPAKVPWLPIKGKDWFIVASAVSDTVVEARTFPYSSRGPNHRAARRHRCFRQGRKRSLFADLHRRRSAHQGDDRL